MLKLPIVSKSSLNSVMKYYFELDDKEKAYGYLSMLNRNNPNLYNLISNLLQREFSSAKDFERGFRVVLAVLDAIDYNIDIMLPNSVHKVICYRDDAFVDLALQEDFQEIVNG